MFLKGKHLKLALTAVAATALVACGGGSGSSNFGSTSSGASSSTARSSEIAGPLDAIQQPLSEQILAPVAEAAAGTPLEGVMSCVEQAVVVNLIDVVDSIAVAAEDAVASGDPTAAFSGAAADIQASLEQFTANASNLLTALAGGTGCVEFGIPNQSTAGLPATGSPLDSLADTLAGGLGGGAPDLTTLTSLFAGLAEEFNTAYAMFLAQVPAEVENAPVLGGVLALLSDAVNDVSTLLEASAALDSAAAAAAAETLLNNALANVLIAVVPVAAVEDATGQQGIVSDQIQAGIDQVTAVIGMVLSAVLDPLASAGSGVPGNGLTGTPLDEVLAPLLDILGGGLPSTPALPALPNGAIASNRPTGTPLDAILAPLLSALPDAGLPALPSDGVTASTPLDGVLSLLTDLLGASGGASPDLSTGTPLDIVFVSLLANLPDSPVGLIGTVGNPALPLTTPLLTGLIDALQGSQLDAVVGPLIVVMTPIADAARLAGLDDVTEQLVLGGPADMLLGLIANQL